jgi:hypothetical protein
MKARIFAGIVAVIVAAEAADKVRIGVSRRRMKKGYALRMNC